MAITKEIISNALLANEKYSSLTLSKLMRNTKDTLLKMFDEIGGDLNSLEPKKEKKTKLAKVDLAMTSDVPSIGLTYSTAHYEMFKIHNDKAIFEDIIDNLMIDEILSKDIKYRDDKDVLHTLTFGTEEHTNACIEFKADVLNPLNRAKKRLKILKFLSEQNSVYVNIINIIKKKESKFSYIKDVIRELREYVKVGEVEKKKFGEVMTPLELVKDMMATLPEEVWSNPNLKWLDNSNGCGPFPAYVIYKLMVGLSEWQPDEDLRYKHIIENMIYVAELQPKNMFLWLFTIDPKDEYKPNIYCGSFLESGFEYHKKNVWGIDKFDMIIGNPPYNEEFSLSGTAKSLFDKFILKSLPITNIIIMVTPSRWFTKTSLVNLRNNLLNNGISLIKHYENASEIFPNTEITGGVSYFYLNKNYKSKNINFNGNIVNLEDQIKIQGSILYNQDSSNTTNNIILKLEKQSKIKNFLPKGYFGIKTNEIHEIGDTICFYSDQRGKSEKMDNINGRYFNLVNSFNDKKNILNKWKVMMASAYGANPKGIGKIDIIEPKQIGNESFVFFYFSTEKESINFKKYLETNFCKFLISLKKSKQDITTKIFELIPEMDFNTEWTDENLFEYFELDDEEKNLILS